MASHDYYTGFGRQDTAYRPDDRRDAPLPLHPQDTSTSKPYNAPPSPVRSPFDDHAYPAYPTPNSSQYNTATNYSSRYEDPMQDSSTLHSYGRGHSSSPYATDPFADQSAIPLQTNKMKDDPYASANSLNDPEQQYGRYDQQKERAPGRQKGWFKGKITYAVYVLTLVQVVVFIVEIVKNGKHGLDSLRPPASPAHVLTSFFFLQPS
jgi:hypothetical protein